MFICCFVLNLSFSHCKTISIVLLADNNNDTSNKHNNNSNNVSVTMFVTGSHLNQVKSVFSRCNTACQKHDLKLFLFKRYKRKFK